MRRAAVAALAAVLLLAACNMDRYPIPTGPPTAEFHPAALDEPVTGVVMYIEARPGERVELIAAEAIGQLEGATVEFYSSPAVVEDDGDVVIGEQLDELEGTIIQAPPGGSADPARTVGIVAEVTAHDPGRYVITGIELTYRYGGTERRGEGVDVVMTVCADDPAPTDCD